LGSLIRSCCPRLVAPVRPPGQLPGLFEYQLSHPMPAPDSAAGQAVHGGRWSAGTATLVAHRKGDESVTSYDYIVVGAGTAGSAVAARLSEDPDVRVLLLEAGPANGPDAVSVPAAWPTLIGSELDWGYSTVEQPGLAGARGRIRAARCSVARVPSTR